jgi:hypothetical protein
MTKELSAKGSGAKRKRLVDEEEVDEERKVRRKLAEPEWASKMTETIEGMSKKMAEDEDGRIDWEEGIEKKVDTMVKAIKTIRGFLEGTGDGVEGLNKAIGELVTKVDGLVAKVNGMVAKVDGVETKNDGDDGTESGEKSDEDQVEETLGTQGTEGKTTGKTVGTTGTKDVDMDEPGLPAS